MNPHFHAVVSIDHRAAHIFSFNWNESDSQVVRHKDAPHQIHNQAAPTAGADHVHEDKAYLSAVAKSLEPFGEILIVGPAQAKAELKTYLDEHAPQIAARVVGVVPMDNHHHEGQLLDFARKYFRRADETTPQLNRDFRKQ